MHVHSGCHSSVAARARAIARGTRFTTRGSGQWRGRSYGDDLMSARQPCVGAYDSETGR